MPLFTVVVQLHPRCPVSSDSGLRRAEGGDRKGERAGQQEGREQTGEGKLGFIEDGGRGS